MDLQALNSGTPITKNWLNPVCGTVDAGTVTTDILVANTVDFKTIEANSLTLVEQKAVPNPAAGSITLFVDSATAMLNSQDSAGNTLPYVPVSGATMTGPLTQGDNTTFLLPDSNGNFNFGTNANAGAGSSIIMDTQAGSSTNSSAGAINMGQFNTLGGQFEIGIGNRINTIGNAFGAINLGGGNTGITNPQQKSIALGTDITLGAGSFGICLGASSGIGNNTNAIVIGNTAVNNISNSCLLGDPVISNIRPNSAVCSLGTVASPFRIVYLRDAAPATGCKYSQYGPVTITNTAADTSYAIGTAVGSLVISANQTPGTIYRYKVNASFSEILADTATLRVKVNGNPLVAMIVGPGLFVSQGFDIEGQIVVLGGGNAQCELRVLLETEPVGITNATSAWNQAIANTLDFSVQYSAADPGNTFVCNSLFVESLYAQ